LYKDYLKYKDRTSRTNSIVSEAYNPFNSNIKLPQPGSNKEEQKESIKKKDGCNC
jgi:hypothetical protein